MAAGKAIGRSTPAPALALALALGAALSACTPAELDGPEQVVGNDIPRIAVSPADPPPASPVSGYAFRGPAPPGQGAGWRGAIVDGAIKLKSPTSAGWVSLAAFSPRMEASRRIYDVPGLTLAIEPGGCALPNHRRALPDRVILDWDGGRFEGCGGPRISPAEIAGTTWQLVRIGAEAASVGRAPAATLTFGPEGSLGGSLACNDGGIRATWTADGRIRPGRPGFEQTAVGCNDPAAEAFGRRFWGEMERATRWWRSGEWLQVQFADGSTAELRLIL